jgi:hypothetical protein
VGSYTLNGWAFPDPGIYPHPDPNWEPGYDPWRPESFRSESEIGRPALTPSSGDGTGFLDGPLGVMPAPTECDLPPTDINDPYAAATWA